MGRIFGTSYGSKRRVKEGQNAPKQAKIDRIDGGVTGGKPLASAPTDGKGCLARGGVSSRNNAKTKRDRTIESPASGKRSRTSQEKER